MSFWEGFAKGWMTVDDAIRRKELFETEQKEKRNKTVLDLFQKRQKELGNVEEYKGAFSWVDSKLQGSDSEAVKAFRTTLAKNPHLAPVIMKTYEEAQKEITSKGGTFTDFTPDQFAETFTIVGSGNDNVVERFQTEGSKLLQQYQAGEISYEDVVTGLSGFQKPSGTVGTNYSNLYQQKDFTRAEKAKKALDTNLVTIARRKLGEITDENEQAKLLRKINLFEQGKSTELIYDFGSQALQATVQGNPDYFTGMESNPYFAPYFEASKTVETAPVDSVKTTTKTKPLGDAVELLKSNPEGLIDFFVETYGSDAVPEEFRYLLK